MLEQAANTTFKLTAQEAELAEQGDNTWVPKLAARVWLESMRSMSAMIEQALPQMVAKISQVQTVQNQAENEFFGSFPELRAHRDRVFQLGHTIRQLHPSMPRAEFNQLLGIQSRALLGVAAPAAPAQAVPGVQQPQGLPAPHLSPAPNSNGGFQPITRSMPTSLSAPNYDPNAWENAVVEMENF